MLTLLDKIISFLAPYQCLACGIEGALLCESCRPLLPDLQPQCYRCHRTDNGNTTCRLCKRKTPLRRVWVRTTYDGFGEALVRKLKFERAYDAARTIAQSMSELDLPRDSILVPVPTATSRVRQRGYDQSVLIAEQLSSHTNLPCVTLLERYGQQRQTGSSRGQRQSQLSHAFAVKHKKLTGVKSIILIDDILTTGATLEIAAAVLRQSGVKRVEAVVFARAV